MLCEVSGSRLRSGDESLMILAYDDITAKHRSEQEILQLNATLEQRVDQRTQELTNTLNQLTAAQAELVRSEKMSALGAMVAGIAHELNTPIGNSLTVASTLQDHSANFLAEMGKGLTRSKLDEFVQNTQQGTSILMRSLHHAAELVSSFKQVAVDQTSVNRRVFRLRETLNEILLTLGPTLRKTTHTVECLVPEDIALDSYPGPLGQIITNLINNALVHAFEGRQNGKIVITATLTQPGWVDIAVRDDGLGIPQAHLDKVFDPFFTTKLGKGGSGLGLNIVYNLVTTSLGGRVQVVSTSGQGACFTLSLPLRVA
jgi:signal transduction histidine kinase